MTSQRIGRPKPSRRRKPKPGAAGPRSAGRLQKAIDEVVRREITAALQETGGVVAAAKLLGVSRIALRARMNALGIKSPRKA
jgi:DNA-binding NtrC family response regulator